MKALIIGRFQPLHLGHVDLIYKTHSLGYEIIIGVGNNNKMTPKYPFTFCEVKKMLELTLRIPFKVYFIPDIEYDSEYAPHVEKITGATSVDTMLVSGNPHTIECFTQYGHKYKVLRPGYDFEVEYKDISGTRIRELMQKNDHWQKLVPNSVKEFLENSEGVEKVKESHRV